MDQVSAPPLPLELLAELSASGVTQRFEAGTVLFEEGEASDALCVLITGHLKVYSAKSNGREVVYSTLEPGQIFGEMFLDGGPRSASVKAITPSSCLIVAGDEIRTLMRAHPSFAEYVVMQVMARLRAATQKCARWHWMMSMSASRPSYTRRLWRMQRESTYRGTSPNWKSPARSALRARW